MVGWLIAFALVALVVGLLVMAVRDIARHIQTSPEERRQKRQKRLEELQHLTSATPNAQMICPHCQVKGQVSTQSVKVKDGISGGKATGAVLTGGVSLLATGLSRKNRVTQATCGNCGVIWSIA